ncbi:MAG: MFS transporter [Actinobacteria bacterium HGW-Actinobacteria-2]|nr:MAG: MFS transporter [Actinobacteria bacterium HGW-Actinobacteria-2]
MMALMMATGLMALDATVLATAVPSVVADLGEFHQFPWLFSVYLLAQAVSVPVYSKLADTIGRKPVLMFGVVLFGVASVLAMAAWNMTALIVFRVLQGLGAGAIGPITMTVVGDLYTVTERPKAQGYIASVWALSSVIGPALGGLFAQYASWRLIFAVNIPLVLVAIWALGRFYHEDVHRRRHRIDYLGTVVLTVGLTAVILALLEGGSAWEWTSWQSIASFAVGIIALAIFPAVERRAAEPVLDVAILRRRLIGTTTVVSLAVGALMTGVTSFVPTYLVSAAGETPVVSGVAIAALTLGWPLASSISGRIYLRHGFRATVVLGASIAVLGAFGLLATGPWPSPWTVAVVCFVIGFGLGWTAVPSLVAAQASVDWHERGLVTGSNMLARSVGSAVGVAVYGAIANNLIVAGGGVENRDGVVTAFIWVFGAVAVSAVLTMLAALRMPHGAVDSDAYAVSTVEPEPTPANPR